MIDMLDDYFLGMYDPFFQYSYFSRMVGSMEPNILERNDDTTVNSTYRIGREQVGGRGHVLGSRKIGDD